MVANGKQKAWWKENAPEQKYKYDYLVALFMHSFSWSFMVMLPIAFINGFEITTIFMCVFIFNLAVHFVVDDLKANQKLINLRQDQGIHLIQILITFFLLSN